MCWIHDNQHGHQPFLRSHCATVDPGVPHGTCKYVEAVFWAKKPGKFPTPWRKWRNNNRRRRSIRKHQAIIHNWHLLHSLRPIEHIHGKRVPIHFHPRLQCDIFHIYFADHTQPIRQCEPSGCRIRKINWNLQGSLDSNADFCPADAVPETANQWTEFSENDDAGRDWIDAVNFVCQNIDQGEGIHHESNRQIWSPKLLRTSRQLQYHHIVLWFSCKSLSNL